MEVRVHRAAFPMHDNPSRSDILGGGNPLWKDKDPQGNSETAYNVLQAAGVFEEGRSMNILVPLCGDCPFCWVAHSKGHTVTGLIFVLHLALLQNPICSPVPSSYTISPPRDQSATD